MNLPQKLSRILLDLKNEATQGIKCTTKSQTVFASMNITVFSLSVCSFENGFLNNKKDNKDTTEQLQKCHFDSSFQNQNYFQVALLYIPQYTRGNAPQRAQFGRMKKV